MLRRRHRGRKRLGRRLRGKVVQRRLWVRRGGRRRVRWRLEARRRVVREHIRRRRCSTRSGAHLRVLARPHSRRMRLCQFSLRGGVNDMLVYRAWLWLAKTLSAGHVGGCPRLVADRTFPALGGQLARFTTHEEVGKRGFLAHPRPRLNRLGRLRTRRRRCRRLAFEPTQPLLHAIASCGQLCERTGVASSW